MNMNWQDYKVDETFIYYDRPLLCTVRDKDGWLGLMMLAEEDEKGEEWLLTPLSEAEKVALKDGQLNVREAFLNRPAYAIYQSITGSAGMRELETVPEAWLPKRATDPHAASPDDALTAYPAIPA